MQSLKGADHNNSPDSSEAVLRGGTCDEEEKVTIKITI